MITLFGFTAPWPLWWLLIAAAVALAISGTAAAAHAVHRTWPERDYTYCDECLTYCSDDYPCPCCAADDGQADELEPIGEYDDGEPVTGELYGPADNPWRIRPQLPVELVDDDEAWTRELADINRARRAGELDELERVPTSVFAALSDDPDVIAWDARQQAARAWEIAHVEFPKLRAQIARDYAAAAAPVPWPPTSWEIAA